MKKKESEKLISVSGLYKSFRTGDRYTKVLQDVNLDIYKSELVIVFGPSGCGKSTLLNSIMGLEAPDSGTVRFGGVNMWDINSDDRADTRKRNFGIMYQQQNWVKSLNVVENIAFPLQLLGVTKEKSLEEAKRMLDVVGLTNRAQYVPSELSSGEQQRVGLARALITKPRIIVADEPTGNLDLAGGLEIVKLLKELTEGGITVVMVTHNPDYLEYSDRTFFMLDGKLLRECITSQENLIEIQKQIKENLPKFISEGNKSNGSYKDIPAANIDRDNDIKDSIFNKIYKFSNFIFKFFLEIPTSGYLLILRRISTKAYDIQRAWISRMFDRIDRNNKISKNINALDLTEIAFRNLFVKKTRTLITICGISLGIGFIVFLLSIGYGIEKLIIEQITEIQNLNQVDIRPIVGSKVVLNEDTVNLISEMKGVEKSFPMMSSASRIEYKGSMIDSVVYGISDGYLESFSSEILIAGGYLQNDDTQSVIVNKELLATMGLDSTDAVGRDLSVMILSFGTVVHSELEDINTEPEIYKIVGVVDDDNSPVMYIPLKKLTELVGNEYSQLTIIASSNNLEIRKQIEVLGFETTSVSDTITEVQSLFSSVKLGLGLFGIVAFIVAILGMINTLTVSLLERTREVGLMKTIGVKSFEIRTLFLSESMIMGFAGGVFGLILGTLLGLIASVVLSVVSVNRDGSWIWINNLPLLLALLVVIGSTLVGFLTGLYPSKRAVRMAPLDALRYE